MVGVPQFGGLLHTRNFDSLLSGSRRLGLDAQNLRTVVYILIANLMTV